MGFPSKRSAREHLTTIHKSQLCYLTDADLAHLDIYLCRHCTDFLTCSTKKLSSHLNTHDKTRSETNLDLATDFLYHEVSTHQQNHWEEGLRFLSHTKFAEPPFRQTLIATLKYRLETDVLRAFHDCIEAAVASKQQAADALLQKSEDFDHTPLFTLPFVFERLVLGPNPHQRGDPRRTSTTQVIYRRLRLFRSGQIKLLYEESNAIESRTPASFAASPVDKSRCAQISADNNNYKSSAERLTKPDTRPALVNDSNIDVIYDLHPPSLNLHPPRAQRATRGGERNRPRVIIHPNILSKVLSQLHRAKAPGIELDSLDIFIKLAAKYRRAKKKKEQTFVNPELLARFFTILVNGDVSARIKAILRTTYLAALRKSETDPRKLRPLGIPSAIRRIMALLILAIYKTKFAHHLLPYNFAFGIQGGVDMVTTSIRLAVEKYITEYENRDECPTRCLISLDIVNMFNAISREKLIALFDREFPELVNFAECLYAEPGRSVVRRDDGRWEAVPVEEGFSQGCPASPVFAAFVLHHILQKINKDLSIKAAARISKSKGDGTTDVYDDNQGGRPLIFTYVDDGNMMIPLPDVADFLRLFEKYGHPLGCRLNTEKTRILTSTCGRKITNRLASSDNPEHQALAESLRRTIATYSRTMGEDGTYTAVEVTDGLRVLGAPIGSSIFCNNFIMDMVSKAQQAARCLYRGLDSKQTVLQLFRTCTAHKLTHLFPADVLNQPVASLPNCWNLYTSQLSDGFSRMIGDILASVTGQRNLPRHAHLIATMSTSTGGLGLPHPRCSAIPSLILSTRRAIQYATKGIYIGKTHRLYKLPATISRLYENWRTSSAPTFTVFRKYSQDIANICVSEQMENSFDFFLYKSSLNTCRERIRLASSKRTKIMLEHEWSSDSDALGQMEDLLDPKMAACLLDMSRLCEDHRRRNDDFVIMLKRKLRLPLWFEDNLQTCFCGRRMDPFGDHALSCARHCKSTLSNNIRDGLWTLFKDLLPLVRLCSHSSSVSREAVRVVRGLPLKRPFDVDVFLDPMIEKCPWHTSLRRIGFDVTVITSKPLTLPTESMTAARKNEIKLRLRDGERGKFMRQGGSDASTGITMTGDEIIQDIILQDFCLIPTAVSPHGTTGSLFDRFMYGTDPLPLPNYDDDHKHAAAADRVARDFDTPRGILKVANEIWRSANPDIFYGDYYKTMDPWTHFQQKFGLAISKGISAHLHRAYNKQRNAPPPLPCTCPDGVCDTTPTPPPRKPRQRKSNTSKSSPGSSRRRKPAPQTPGCSCCAAVIRPSASRAPSFSDGDDHQSSTDASDLSSFVLLT